MTVDIQMNTDKGDVEMDKGGVEMRDADKDSKLNIDHLEESENGVSGAKLETKDQEHAETLANDEPVQDEPLKDCGELPGDNIAEGNVDGQPTNSDGESPGDNIAEGNVDGQPTNNEDKPDVLVNLEILDGSKSIAPDVKEDPSNTQGTQEHSSIMSESVTETEQICSNSDNDGGKVAKGEIDNQEKLLFQLPVSEVPPKRKTDENIQSEKEESVKKLLDKPHQIKAEVLLIEPKGTEKSSFLQPDASEDNLHLAEKTIIEVTKPSHGNSPVGNRHLPATPDLATQSSAIGSGSHNGRLRRSSFSEVRMTESDDGTPEEQAAFVKELEGFYRERDVEFKPPKFYGQLLNLLKLWRAVIKLGGYDLVTGSKSWRNVGESFHPPKTCTTVSWTFRIFYEKSLLEYERYLRQTGELQLPEAAFSELTSVDNEGNGQQASGSGRARRDAAARAMQGWHVQRLFGHNEDKNVTSMPKRENKVKSIGSIKQKRPDEIELPVKAQRTDTSKQLTTSVVDIGAPADWVKINVRETKDCFEVYALVPGLLREEVRVQSDPAGRLVITGQPEQPDNPWGITAFRKVVTLPARIDPLQTSAVVSLHGRLFVRVPFEQ